MILAVAASVGVRRLLSPESIYTLKLVRRGHVIPNSLHANVFVVKRAAAVMDRDVTVARATVRVEDLPLRAPDGHEVKYIVIADQDRIVGAIRVNRPLARLTLDAKPAAKLGDLVSGTFCVVRERDVFFNVIRRMWRKRADIAIVVHDRGGPRPDNVAGVITKELVADSVASSIVVLPTPT